MKNYPIAKSPALFLFLALLSAIQLGTPRSEAGEEWEYMLEFYGLGSTIEGTTSIGRLSGVPVNVGFGDILDNLELAAMIHFEAFTQNKGFILDYGFMDLGAGRSGIRGVTDASVHQGVLEALYAFRESKGNRTTDYFIGLRAWDTEVDLVVDASIRPGSASASLDQSWLDLIIGVRSSVKINDRWNTVFSVDIGGAGLESRLTSSAYAGAHYRLSDNWFLDLKYKGTYVDFYDGERGSPGAFEYDTGTHGPIIGIIRKF